MERKAVAEKFGKARFFLPQPARGLHKLTRMALGRGESTIPKGGKEP